MTDFSNMSLSSAPSIPEKGVARLGFGAKRVRFTFSVSPW